MVPQLRELLSKYIESGEITQDLIDAFTWAILRLPSSQVLNLHEPGGFVEGFFRERGKLSENIYTELMVMLRDIYAQIHTSRLALLMGEGGEEYDDEWASLDEGE